MGRGHDDVTICCLHLACYLLVVGGDLMCVCVRVCVRACARVCCVVQYQTVGLCVRFVLLRDVRSAPSQAHAARAFKRSRNQIDRRTQAHHDAAHKRCGLRTSACS
jgi:hypothetical protein